MKMKKWQMQYVIAHVLVNLSNSLVLAWQVWSIPNQPAARVQEPYYRYNYKWLRGASLRERSPRVLASQMPEASKLTTQPDSSLQFPGVQVLFTDITLTLW
jgi:hypothetical protein